jgi:tRNA(Arg) A34 adenosine deaminase TadA
MPFPWCTGDPSGHRLRRQRETGPVRNGRLVSPRLYGRVGPGRYEQRPVVRLAARPSSHRVAITPDGVLTTGRSRTPVSRCSPVAPLGFGCPMSLRSEDEGHLLGAIALARQSREKGNHPFGSLLVDSSGRVLLEAENTVVVGRDVTGHAELNLVRAASMRFAVEALRGSTLYTSTEPCAMCAGAIYWSEIGRVVYALGSETLTAMLEDVGGTSTLALSCLEVFARGGRTIDVSGPHLMEEAAAVHEGFWD